VRTPDAGDGLFVEGRGILDEKGVHSYANSALALMLGLDSSQQIVGNRGGLCTRSNLWR